MDWTSFLAPIDSYTNLPFRLMCQRYGADACCVPLVSAYTISRERSKISMIDTHADERNVGIQFVGKEPEPMGAAVKEIQGKRSFSWLNLNCGCPSAHTTGSGGGSALLKHPDVIVRMVEELRGNSKPSTRISVKMRIRDNPDDTLALCRRIEGAVADFIIIHGRTPQQGYSGRTDWELIKRVKEKSRVPIVGNGDIKNAAEGRLRIEGGFCDAFMIGRAAMGNPLCFSDKAPVGFDERFALIDEYMAICEKYVEGGPALADIKLKAMNLLAAVPGACALRNTIAKAKTIEEIMALREREGKNRI
jgi:tRNA-dihydrouridine synthase B